MFVYLFYGLILQPFLRHSIRDHPAPPETTAIANLRTINTAEVTYRWSSGRGDYGTMTDLIAAGLLDDTFTGTKYRYNYSITVDPNSYTAIALPASKEDRRYGYFTRSDARVRYMDRHFPTCTPCFPKGQAGEIVP
jgi:hypothetical protein